MIEVRRHHQYVRRALRLVRLRPRLPQELSMQNTLTWIFISFIIYLFCLSYIKKLFHTQNFELEILFNSDILFEPDWFDSAVIVTK